MLTGLNTSDTDMTDEEVVDNMKSSYRPTYLSFIAFHFSNKHFPKLNTDLINFIDLISVPNTSIFIQPKFPQSSKVPNETKINLESHLQIKSENGTLK